jgi:hypothetical protein
LQGRYLLFGRGLELLIGGFDLGVSVLQPAILQLQFIDPLLESLDFTLYFLNLTTRSYRRIIRIAIVFGKSGSWSSRDPDQNHPQQTPPPTAPHHHPQPPLQLSRRAIAAAALNRAAYPPKMWQTDRRRI